MYRALAECLAGHCFVNARYCSPQGRCLLLSPRGDPCCSHAAPVLPSLPLLLLLQGAQFWSKWSCKSPNGAVRAQTPLHAIHFQGKVKYLEGTVFILPQLSIITTISLPPRFQMKNFEGNWTLQVFRADPWKVTQHSYLRNCDASEKCVCVFRCPAPHLPGLWDSQGLGCRSTVH